MRIGIDFDNTIACYDGVFHRAAVERGLVPETLATDKTSIRDYLRSRGREDDWTELQGHVYGAAMHLVALYPGVDRFFERALRNDHAVMVISHKTRFPYRGPPYDLHKTARDFLSAKSLRSHAESNVFFELTLEEKLARIEREACDVFIDDLPELFAESAFARGVRQILFDPHERYAAMPGIERHSSWASIEESLLGRHDE